VIAFVRRQPNRGFCLLSVCCFLLTFAFNLMAPGIAARQSATGEPTSPLMTVITTVLDSFDTFGGWLSPHLIAMLMLALPVLWKPLKESGLSFKHPFWFFVLMYGLFSASMAPGVYVMNTYDKGRYMNVIYLEFLLLAFAASAYAEGWLIRFLERRGGEKSGALRAARPLGQRFTALYLALSLALLTFGGFSFTIMNTSSVCALKSLVTGEAAQFHREMKQREEYIRVTPSDDTHVSQLSGQPYIFKADKLPLQGTFGRLRYMKWYFELFYSAEPPQGE
ncbi:MAG: hypothetical protein PHY12_09075, partial [Eubacteriales bacterium]|nr:hypothetical protein [Eubacteriales bacterium]